MSLHYSLYIFFGFLPSIVWLSFYLKKDLHPEPKKMLIKVFCFGMLATLPTLLLEIGFQSITRNLNLPLVIISILNVFIGIAFIEELLKFLVVKGEVVRSSAFDEPMDAMIYMIVAALGFSAIENILFLFPLGPIFIIKDVFVLTLFRFIGATFLHALCSGTIGFFIALALFRKRMQTELIILGLGITTVLHGLYNFSIIKSEGYLKILIPVVILIGLSIFVSLSFKKVKKMANTYKIN